EDLVMDGWTEIIGKLLRGRRGNGAAADPATIAQTIELADFEKMEQIRARAEAIVEDKETAEALKPYYRQFCKRPCSHDEYLQTYNRPNVTLVDTAGRGVERITERGVVANGVEYEVDCIIFASGFELPASFKDTPWVERARYEVYGRDGIGLSDKWSAGVSTLFGLQTHGFPNLFFFQSSQAGASSNQPHLYDIQSRQAAYVVQQTRARGA